jgi:hypothetical protein
MKSYIIEQVGDKWVLWSKDKKKKLGEHDSKEEAEAQERAIQKAKHMAAVAGQPDIGDLEAVKLFEETATIKNVDIFAVGTWYGVNSPKEGDTYTKEDLEDMVKAHGAGIMSAKLKLTHGNDKEQPNIGEVANLRVENNTLYGDFVNVPKALYEFMKKSGAFARRSAEVLWNLKDKAGKTWKRVLKAVALLAPGQKPAVGVLSDGYQFEAVYCYECKDVHDGLVNIFEHEKPTGGGDEMDPEEIKKLLKKYNVETIEELDAAIQADKSQVQAYASEKTKIRAELRKQFIDLMKTEGKILPKEEGVLIALFEAVDSLESAHEYEVAGKKEKGSTTDMLKAFISGLPKRVDFKETSKVDDSKVDPEKSPAAEVDRLAKQYVQEGKAKDYNAAVELVSENEPELWTKYLSKT